MKELIRAEGGMLMGKFKGFKNGKKETKVIDINDRNMFFCNMYILCKT